MILPAISRCSHLFSQIRVVGSVSKTRPFPPILKVQVNRLLYRGLTGAITYQTGWPLIIQRAIEQGRTPSSSWSSSQFSLGLSARQWSGSLDVRGTVGRVVLSGERNFELSDSTTLSVGAEMDPFRPVGIAFTLSATQNWADLISGGLAVTLSTVFSVGGVQLIVK